MARHIWFDDECITQKYDCFLKTYSIDPAEVRTVTDTAAGVDGIIDATEWLGRPVFENRDGEFEFLFMPDGGWDAIMQRVTAFRNKYHGRVVQIETDDEPGSYYEGRVTFGAVSNIKGSAQFSVDADLDPFRYTPKTLTFETSTDSQRFNIKNNGVRSTTATLSLDGESVKVVITGSTTTTITLADGVPQTVELLAGKYTSFRIYPLTGTLQVTYTEESL